MHRAHRNLVLIAVCVVLCAIALDAQDDIGWRISPEKINIQIGEARALQLLDDSAQELRGATWTVDDPNLADVEEVDGRALLHAKTAGTVRVIANLGSETRFREIVIWPEDSPFPPGTTHWSMHPIGREIGDIPAVPTADGVNLFSLEQTAAGETYLRGGGEDGIQLWAWRMPEKVADVELVCGDWMGGALISANYGDSFPLYTVGKDGRLRWQHTFLGARKGHAYNLQHLVHIVSQTSDRLVAKVTALDEQTGDVRFELNIPQSREKLTNVGTIGSSVVCAATSATNPLALNVSRIMVNMDGNAYFAFTQNEWEIEAKNCIPGAKIDPHSLIFHVDEKLFLWQIHPDGTYRSSIVEAVKLNQPLSDPVTTVSPTGAIVTDNMEGVLVPVRLSHTVMPENIIGVPDEYVYRVDAEGEVAYKFLLPRYSGDVKDEMVIGGNELAFATRGGILVAFNQRVGKELWRWDSGTSEISVVAALADGSCLVQTPAAVMQVENSTTAKKFIDGQVILGWHGEVYRKQ